MKISFELQPCCGNKSGIGVYTYELAKRLHSHDGISYQGNLFNFIGRNDNSHSLVGISFPIKENRMFPYGVYRRIWDKIPICYDHLFSEADISVFFNFIVPPRIGGEVITTVHDITYLLYPETVDAKNLKRLHKGIDYSLQRSSRILTVSEFSKKEISQHCSIPMENIEVVYPASSILGGLGDFSELKGRLHLKDHYILFVGSIEPRKNLTRLLQAFDLLKAKTKLEHQLVLCGGKGWNNDSIHDQLHKMQYRQDVLFTGYLTDTERNTLYHHADAMVFPSIYEGFGVPPLEAMYWKTPVICSNAASLPEVAGDAACYVDPFSVDSIVQGMERVLLDEHYAAELVNRGSIQQKKYSWDYSAQQLENILCRIKGD